MAPVVSRSREFSLFLDGTGTGTGKNWSRKKVPVPVLEKIGPGTVEFPVIVYFDMFMYL